MKTKWAYEEGEMIPLSPGGDGASEEMEVEVLSEMPLCRHYVVVNPKTGRMYALFADAAGNYWINEIDEQGRRVGHVQP